MGLLVYYLLLKDSDLPSGGIPVERLEITLDYIPRNFAPFDDNHNCD
jgi:hypothetical protein